MFRKKKPVVLCLRPPQNRTFHAVVVNRKQKKCTKMRDARAMLLCCQSKPIAFLPFSFRRRRRCLSSLMTLVILLLDVIYSVMLPTLKRLSWKRLYCIVCHLN